jgi:hypothetical protein
MSGTLNLDDPKAALEGQYVPTAVYFLDSDCVEYVRNDEFCVYDRVDAFLTLIFDQTKYRLIGFKLKGFKCLFEQFLQPLFELKDEQFIELVPVIEAAFTRLGDKLSAIGGGEEKRVRAYKAALKLAAEDRVKLWALFIPPQVARRRPGR